MNQSITHKQMRTKPKLQHSSMNLIRRNVYFHPRPRFQQEIKSKLIGADAIHPHLIEQVNRAERPRALGVTPNEGVVEESVWLGHLAEQLVSVMQVAEG